VNEEEPKFDCTMMELQENDTLSVPAEYLNDNEHQMQFVSIFLLYFIIECQKHHYCDRIIVELKARVLVKAKHRSLQSMDSGVWRR
jgi:hypothetical protein